MEKTYENGRYLFREHEYGDQAFHINSGEVEIIKVVGDKPQVVATVGPGSILGEMALINEEPRLASARAQGIVLATTVSKGEFERMLLKTDPLIRGVLRILAESVRDLVKS